MPTQQTVKCDACGALAIVTSTDGVLFPDPKYRGAKIVHTIDCPHCGLREQPAQSLATGRPDANT